MSVTVPQYSDAVIVFNNIQYNIEPSSVDLDAVDDIILSISAKNIDLPEVVLQYTINPERFTIDNVNKVVSVQILASEITNIVGVYFTNLWISADSHMITHATSKFSVRPSVKYSLT